MPGLPFGLGRLNHFVFYVYGGYYLWIKRDWFIEKSESLWVLVVLWIIYAVIVVLRHSYLPKIEGSMSLWKGFIYLFNNATGLLVSCCGIIALFTTVFHYTEKKGYRPKQWVINASNDCYGVYVFHQFIMVYLYYFTPLVGAVNSIFVPWIGFIVSFLVSLLLTKLFLKTKTGRFLIG